MERATFLMHITAFFNGRTAVRYAICVGHRREKEEEGINDRFFAELLSTRVETSAQTHKRIHFAKEKSLPEIQFSCVPFLRTIVL